MLLSNNYTWDQPEMDYADDFGNSFIAESENNTAEFNRTLTFHQRKNESAGAATHLNANNAHMDIASEKDLANNSTVESLVRSAKKRSKRIVKEGKAGSTEWEAAQREHSIRPLLEDISIAQCGDGKPMIELNKLRRTKNNLSKTITGLGGFHLGLIAWKAVGRLFSNAFIGPIFSLWRETENQLNWVMNPGDPNQVIRETNVVIYAIYIEAIRGYVRSKSSCSGNDYDDDDMAIDLNNIEVTAVEVFDFMCERAKEDPLILVALLYLRLVHTIQLLYESERKADISLFISCVRYILLWCCISHSVGYVSLLCDWIRDWECASPAKRVIREKVILFRKTVFGENIFTDRFME